MVYQNRPRGLRLSLPRMNPGGLAVCTPPRSLVHSHHFRVASAQRAASMFAWGSRHQVLMYARHALKLLLSAQGCKEKPGLEDTL